MNNRILAAQLPADALVVDVRTVGEYQTSHFAGSINCPLQAIQAGELVACLNETSSEPVYLLCQSGKRSAMAAELLASQCKRPLVLVSDGIEGCVSDKLVSGERAIISLERQVRIAAGSLVLLGCVLGTLLAPVWFALSAFVGAGLVFAGITDTCGMAMLLARMPWNSAKNTACKA